MRFFPRFATLLIVLFVLAGLGRAEEAGTRPATRNVVLVTTDGLRWQEVFRDVDASLASLLGEEYSSEVPQARTPISASVEK